MSVNNALLGLIAKPGQRLLGKVTNFRNSSKPTTEYGDGTQPLCSIPNARRTNSQPLLKRQLGYDQDERDLRHRGPAACPEEVSAIFAAPLEPRRVLQVMKAWAPGHDEA